MDRHATQDGHSWGYAEDRSGAAGEIREQGLWVPQALGLRLQRQLLLR